jgi:hypothetical protein
LLTHFNRRKAENEETKMKTFKQLTDTEQVEAVSRCLDDVLKLVTEGDLRFNDSMNHDDLQKRIDAAQEKAEQMRTPWFAHEYIMDTCREDLTAMAQGRAEDALYSSPDEFVISGVASN